MPAPQSETVTPESLHSYVANYREQGQLGKLSVFFQATKTARKFGFPIVCTLHGQTERERMVSAIRFLLSVTEVAEVDSTVADALYQIYKDKHTVPRLIEDARNLMVQSTATTLTLQA